MCEEGISSHLYTALHYWLCIFWAKSVVSNINQCPTQDTGLSGPGSDSLQQILMYQSPIHIKWPHCIAMDDLGTNPVPTEISGSFVTDFSVIRAKLLVWCMSHIFTMLIPLLVVSLKWMSAKLILTAERISAPRRNFQPQELGTSSMLFLFFWLYLLAIYLQFSSFFVALLLINWLQLVRLLYPKYIDDMNGFGPSTLNRVKVQSLFTTGPNRDPHLIVFIQTKFLSNANGTCLSKHWVRASRLAQKVGGNGTVYRSFIFPLN